VFLPLSHLKAIWAVFVKRKPNSIVHIDYKVAASKYITILCKRHIRLSGFLQTEGRPPGAGRVLFLSIQNPNSKILSLCSIPPVLDEIMYLKYMLLLWAKSIFRCNWRHSYKEQQSKKKIRNISCILVWQKILRNNLLFPDSAHAL